MLRKQTGLENHLTQLVSNGVFVIFIVLSICHLDVLIAAHYILLLVRLKHD